MRFVVDASVVAKWFNVETLSDRAAEVKDAHVRGELELAAPIHVVYEVGNSIWKNPQLTDKDANDAIRSIQRLGMQFFPPSLERASRTMKIARLRNITFYDATYLQVAEELNTTLLTADERQAEAGKGVVRVVHLHEIRF
jgi:predicted nucleic acid-binding protein